MARRSTHTDALSAFDPLVREWFLQSFSEPTNAQNQAWQEIDQGNHTLLLAPTGSGKTLAAFLVAINRIMFGKRPEGESAGVRVLYISPLKALGVDVERNLRGPIAGVRAVAERHGTAHHVPSVGVRSGDTPTAERAKLVKQPPDILITTPESLYLLLTSRSREILANVDTIIVDEIHALVGSKRGAHLVTSLERLEDLRRRKDPHRPPAQRIGLSATQRPLDEVARFLGGAEIQGDDDDVVPRKVSIVEAGRTRQLKLRIEVPVEDMTKLGVEEEQFSGPAAGGPVRTSIWPSIHPRLVELIRQHRSTMIFVNSRRLAERLAGAINELAEEEIALAHHGSIAKDIRLSTEDRLKLGTLPAIVATSSLELGIDMGAVDLVVQIEAPPSIASGIQRIGRAGHQVGAPSSGVIFPKYRGDLLACSAAAERMIRGEVEETFYPRNPLDVLAQQIVAMVSLEPVSVKTIYDTMRRAAPFAQLPRSSFEGVLDLLAGRYPSHEFAELRPRVNWDRLAGIVSPRKGTQRLAILNAGTIPDRGTYGVFLAGNEGKNSRVGELDEEMVFETRPGDIFLLGASSWRVLEITKDQVLVVPAPGEAGKMPFWRGDGPGRPMEFGRAIGSLSRRLVRIDRDEAQQALTTEHSLDERAATNLLTYLHDQAAATEEPPSDKTIIIECFVDEVGDWRVCILSPFGSRVHAPWAMAVAARLRNDTPGEVDMMWTDDGIVFRLPEADEPPPVELFLPSSSEIEEEIVEQVGTTALFAAHFRENAARALLLPRRQPGKRTPLWLQRRKAADLLSVASKYSQFPILLETYRECLRDVFDIKGLRTILQEIEKRAIRVKQVISSTASPFASSLMFNYVSNFLYDGDAPLAERRAATLSLDQAQLCELLGTAELRELLDAEVISQLGLELQLLERSYPVTDADGVHEVLLLLGDLSRDELLVRLGMPQEEATEKFEKWLTELSDDRRILPCRIAGALRYIAAEDAARYRDAVGIAVPRGLPAVFLQPSENPLVDLVGRFARRHIPFRTAEVAERFGLAPATVSGALKELSSGGRVLEGEFLPGQREREWCDAEVLRQLKRRSLARLREQVEPVEQAALARFLVNWQGILQPRRGLDNLLDVIEQLQGLALPASDWERLILPARISDFRPSDLDELCSSGEVLWRGAGALGPDDGRIAFYLVDHFSRLTQPSQPTEGELEEKIRASLNRRNAVFFDDLAREIGGFKNDLVDALWHMVWTGEVTNDTLIPLRSLRQKKQAARKSTRSGRAFRSRRVAAQAGTEGRWSLLNSSLRGSSSPTEHQMAVATQLIERYGVVTREMVASEGVEGGFSRIYPVFKEMEEIGRIRRGYFVAGLGAAQFAAPGADDRIRENSRSGGILPPINSHAALSVDDHIREQTTTDESLASIKAIALAATDPANPYGAALPWPDRPDDARPARTAGARVLMFNGSLIGYLNRSSEQLLTFLPEDEPQLSKAQSALVELLRSLSTESTPIFLNMIDRLAPEAAPIAKPLQAAGFVSTSRGFLHRRR